LCHTHLDTLSSFASSVLRRQCDTIYKESYQRCGCVAWPWALGLGGLCEGCDTDSHLPLQFIRAVCPLVSWTIVLGVERLAKGTAREEILIFIAVAARE